MFKGSKEMINVKSSCGKSRQKQQWSNIGNGNDGCLVGKVRYYLNSLKQLGLNSIVDNEGWQLWWEIQQDDK